MPRTIRWLPILIGLAACLCLPGCDVQKALQETAGKAPSVAPGRDAGRAPSPARAPAGDTIRIASFNIQVFGTSKMSKPDVMDVLAKVVRQFDVVAIQEVRSKDETLVPRFAELVNASGARYGWQVGPRLGRTSSKEQYAFLYDTDRIELVPGSVYTAPDPADLLHREPLVARFRVRGPPPEEAFSFTLVDIHTDPDETATELDALADVFAAVQHDGSGEDDVILLGDLNEDEQHLGKLGRLPGIAWAISGRKTNTRQTHGYDNILFDRRATGEFTGYSGVLDVMAEFGLTTEQALEVSDHLPVWAEFRAREAGAPPVVATRPQTSPR
jgi:deoxyribonuclease-1-like protein